MPGSNNPDWIGLAQGTIAIVDAIFAVVLLIFICAEPAVNTAVAAAVLDGWSRILLSKLPSALQA